MSVSIYYSARRDRPLTPEESAEVTALIASYSIGDQLGGMNPSDEWGNAEDFCVYPRESADDQGLIFGGATKLADTSQDVMWRGVRHWCQLLSAIRCHLPDAEWSVHVDDYDIRWNESRSAYDPGI